MASMTLLFNVGLIVKVDKECNNRGSIEQRRVLHPHGERAADHDGAYRIHHAHKELRL